MYVEVYYYKKKRKSFDARNSKVEDIIVRLKEYGGDPIVVDPVADRADDEKFYNIKIADMSEVNDADCVIFAVSHDCFKELTLSEIDLMYKKIGNNQKVLIDIKNSFDIEELEKSGYSYWRL